MTGLLSDKSIQYMQWITCGVCALAFAYCIAETLHWQIVWDQSVIRYVRFLMSRGMRPYSDITDMNMPGCYLAEAAGMAVFGWGDLGWRIYEYCLIAAVAFAGMAIGGRRYWMTGVFGATTFMLACFTDGEAFSLERNEVMGALDLLGVTFFILAVQKRKPALLGVASAFIGLAATMKPGGVLLGIFLFVVLVVVLKRDQVPLRSYLMWASSGFAFACLVAVGFLVHEHAVRGFLFVMLRVWPAFRTMSPQTPVDFRVIPRFVVPSFALAVVAAYKHRHLMPWERWAFFLAMIYGIISYKLEGGEAHYHRYVFLIFLVTWVGWEAAISLRETDRPSRAIGIASLALLVGLIVPHYVLMMHRVAYQTPVLEAYPAGLQADLERLGGAKLQGQVECLEMVDGCLRTLYEMRLVQNTGSTGDLLLFTSKTSPASVYYRDWFRKTQEKSPANVIVFGNFSFETKLRSFDRLNAWPEYADYLRANYVLAGERHFGSNELAGYRIYVRKGSDLPQCLAAPCS